MGSENMSPNKISPEVKVHKGSAVSTCHVGHGLEGKLQKVTQVVLVFTDTGKEETNLDVVSSDFT